MKAGITIALLLFAVAELRAVDQASIEPGGEKTQSATTAIPVGKTIARRFLALEFNGTSEPALEQKLEAMVERAVQKFGSRQPREGESAAAQRFFHAVDTALIEEDVIFPPSGQVDLLCNALRPQNLTPAEYSKALNLLPNLRRRGSIEANKRAGGPFYCFDCDVAGLVYLSAAERLGLPVYIVEVPGHNFVRWSSSTLQLNWDTNDGVLTPDAYYYKPTAENQTQRELLGYLENRTEARLTSYWLVRCAQARMRKGDYAGALKNFRAAVSADPKDLSAQGELAWALATSPDEHLRDGVEAREIAERLVSLMRSRSWIETLAAACAETGDFTSAVRLQKEAEQWVLTHHTKVPAEIRAYHKALIAAYEKRLTYAAAVKGKLLEAADSAGGAGR